MSFGYFMYSHSLVPVIDLWISGRDKVGIRALIAIDEIWCIVLCSLFTTAAIRLKICLCRIPCPCIPLFEFCSLSFQIKGKAQNIPANESAEEGEHSFIGEVPPDPPRRRGRGRGRPRVAQVLGLVLVPLVADFIRDSVI